MRLQTLWSVILKIFGIYFAIGVVDIGIVMFPRLTAGDGNFIFLGTEVVILIVEIILAFLFLYRTHLIIDRFKLVSSEEEKILQFNFAPKKVMRLAIAIIGLYTLTQAIPELFLTRGGTPSNLLYILSKIAIAALMILKAEELEQLLFKNTKDEMNNDRGTDI